MVTAFLDSVFASCRLIDLMRGPGLMFVVRRQSPLEKVREGSVLCALRLRRCVSRPWPASQQDALKSLTRFTASGRLVFLLTLLQTLPQEVHDIDDLALLFGPWRRFRRFNGLGLTRLDLLVDQL